MTSIDVAIENSIAWLATNTVTPMDEMGLKRIDCTVRQTVFDCLCCNQVPPHEASEFDIELAFEEADEGREILQVKVILTGALADHH